MRAVRASASASILVVVGLVVGTGPAEAQSTATVEVDSTHITVGDRITMTVRVEHPPGATVVWPDSVDLSPFEVLESHTDTARSSATFTLTAFELGMLEIPSLEVVVEAPDGGEETVSTSPFAVEVASVGADESGDIRDIRGPLGLPMSALRMALLVLLPLLLAALLFVVARRLRARKETSPRPAIGPLPRPPHEIALEALAALGGSGLLERGEVKQLHIEASDILRTYVEARFHVDALEMTTHEVLGGLERDGVEPRFRDGLRAFLEQCDLVKFAKVRPDADASRQLLELGRRLVLDSVPAPEPVVTADARGSETSAVREEARV
ncbi:MAG: BatD family protein [Gemmatimonadales bacterium]